VLKFEKTLSYDDVLLVPQYSDIKSRSEIDIGNNLDTNIRLDTPIISSPMDTVSETETAIAMCRSGGMSIIHRYCDIEKQASMVRNASQRLTIDSSIHPSLQNIGAAIGVRDSFLKRAEALVEAGANVICVDVAHGHHVLVERAIERLRNLFGNHVHLMAGNVATAEGYLFLNNAGADSVRCNIGGGSICSTRIQTGHGVPGFHTLRACSQANGSAVIIADGGIRSSGDIVKALAAGADFVMAGSLFAGTAETPGSVLDIDGIKYKEYRGMASKEARANWTGKASHSEGISTMIPFKGNISYTLKDLSEGVKSGFSYSGARNIEELWAKAKFIEQTFAGQAESNTHILTRK